MLKKIFMSLPVLLATLAVAQESTTPPIIRGIYGSPTPFWEKGYRLDSLGVNAIFVRSSSISTAIFHRAQEEGLTVYVEFPTLNGKGYVEKHPEAWAIDERGMQVEPAGWFMGVCPTEPGFRSYREQQLRALLQTYPVEGIWLDYVHWHAQFEEPEPILPETCFNQHCLNAFEIATGIEPPAGSISEKAQWILSHHEEKWRAWRSEVIAEWVGNLKEILLEERPDALLGLYHCPWEDSAFDGARRRILGLDYGLLSAEVDVFSPMLYHERMGRSAEWVGENIQWFSRTLEVIGRNRAKIWPIVQAYQVQVEEFRTVLEAGLSSGSSGVMMFTGRAVVRDLEKVNAMQAVFSSSRRRRN